MVTQLNNRSCLEHSVLVDDQLTMAERVDVAFDQEEIRAALDGQEALARYIDAVSILEVLDGSTGGSLKLNDSMAVISGLGIDDNV